MRPIRSSSAPARLGVGLAAAALALTSCSGDDSGGGGGSGSEEDATEQFTSQSAEEIVTAAKDAMTSAESMRFAGEITDGGDTIQIDNRVARSGDCAGTVGGDNFGGSSEFVQVGKRAWIRPDEDFWRTAVPQAADQIIARVGDRWVQTPLDQVGLNASCDLESLLEELDPAEAGEVGEVGDVDGQEAVAVSSTAEEETTMWIATEEPHHVLRLESSAEDDGGTITFSDFDEVEEIEPPAKGEVAQLN